MEFHPKLPAAKVLKAYAQSFFGTFASFHIMSNVPTGLPHLRENYSFH